MMTKQNQITFHTKKRIQMNSIQNPSILFQPYKQVPLSLSNRMVMAPMTRNRAVDHNTPNALMATYYGQRSSAGLIITEGASPSPNGLGYPRIPGLFNSNHVNAWKLITKSVHDKGGKIVVQLMHGGRVAHIANLPMGAKVLGLTNETLPGEMYTDALGMQQHTPPQAMTLTDIKHAIEEYALSCQLAMEAGFDGVELHAANGYLIEQFLNANVNQRTDEYGGNANHRNRFALDIIKASIAAIGNNHVGIRVSPYGVFNSTGAFEGVDQQYTDLVKECSNLKLMYLHLLDHSAMGGPEVPASLKQTLHEHFKGSLILTGGFDRQTAESALAQNKADLIGFGKPFISNPDLVERYKANAALNPTDKNTFYSPGEKGYSDYPSMS